MAVTLSTTPSMNKRWPPLADKTSLPYRLTTLSKQKLAREATAPDPDIRRCLGHFRLHCTSMEWAQRDMTSRINSFDLDSDSEDEEETPDDEVQEVVERLAEKASTVTITDSAAKEETTLHSPRKRSQLSGKNSPDETFLACSWALSTCSDRRVTGAYHPHSPTLYFSGIDEQET
ncbi:hypothetical protein BA78_7877 [Aspergillus fumigatus]|nr:hypothetical protein BA78_7877 [Aspergillus fumigatus]